MEIFGYILLGFILEKIYGKTLEEIYNNNIAEPLGLKYVMHKVKDKWSCLKLSK